MTTTLDDWLLGRRHLRYGTAVTRIAIGVVLVAMLALNWPDRRYTWGIGASWTEPVRRVQPWPDVLAWLTHVGPTWFDLVYLLTIAAGVAMVIGWRTRTATVLALVGWVSLFVANPFVTTGGDAVMRMVLLWLCLTDAGGRWSLDARRLRRGPDRWWVTLAHNVGVVLILHQLVMVYVGASLYKLEGVRWRDGTAVYYPLQTEAFSPWIDALGPLYSWAPFVHVGSWSAIGVQLLLPVLLLYRPTRLLALVAITVTHLMIGFVMGIMFFSLVMIAVDMMLISDRSWQSVGALLGRARDRSRTFA